MIAKITKEDNFERFLRTYSGKQLLEKHKLDEEGVWEVRGEDPNCDWGGAHHQPYLGTFEGRLRDVIEHAVELGGFWQWGAGGSIKRHNPPRVKKINPKTQARRKEIQSRLDDLETEVQALREELKQL